MPDRIEHIITMGDSLSDRGTMDHRKLFGLIPMDGLSGLKGKSPKGRFTNGYVWDDNFSNEVADEAIIRELKRHGKTATDIADDVITSAPEVEGLLYNNFDLGNNRHVNFKGQDFVRNYNEGGLTAYDYSQRVIPNPKLLAEEEILSTLDKKRQLLLEDDNARIISEEHKKRTLIVEWSGANDLITVNSKPTNEEAEKAVQARLRNVEELIKSGYRHFALFNLPDLSLTPRFQRQGKEEQNNAHKVAMYFNQQLQKGIEQLSATYRDCAIDVFDINAIFTEAYNHPEKFQLDPAKKHIPYTESNDFNIKANGTSPADGYLFWDDVHPSADMHAILGQKFYDKYSQKYHFVAPHESLLAIFRETYGQKLRDDKQGKLGWFRYSNISYATADLETILRHALSGSGQRTRQVITELGWINKDGELISKNPALQEAMKQIKESSQESSLSSSHIS
ncbi:MULTISPECIES: SGNH/GDSL hydrolase family protein [unclassified Legionella]|uniref:SGNH/GDSL hydrolase family protein n=1 Tax=unclassified Legionella TaxID=2622702 RepID=UPI001056DB56|nr:MULTISPECIES: SGNH/GDSL hydrolase family protein [unclassified Legionella]MDI9817645.1 SGNH/GDSL hydrolase family protein [Legionella sp. PL877]